MKKSINQKQAIEAIANLDSFEASALSAREAYNSRPPLGRLNSEDIVTFYEATHNSGGMVYIVYSYGTPIAWYVYSTNQWHIVDQKFSATTSKHQNYTRRGIAQSQFGKVAA
jgi:hypothetical protein